MPYRRDDLAELPNCGEYGYAHLDVRLNLIVLRRRQLARLAQQDVGDADLANVMQQPVQIQYRWKAL
jgi:hypothetical protein